MCWFLIFGPDAWALTVLGDGVSLPTLHYLFTLAMQHGGIWVGARRPVLGRCLNKAELGLGSKSWPHICVLVSLVRLR